MDLDKKWIDLGDVWEHNAEQGSEDWLDMHNRFLTASRFGTAVGHSIFSTPEQLKEELEDIRKGLPGKQFSPDQQENMRLGVLMEPVVRDWFHKEKLIPLNLNVIEKGLIVPKWDDRIGASLDGLIIDQTGARVGMIEIKCPKKMYQKLIKYGKDLNSDLVFPIYYHEHIFDSHYDQMQGCMAIMNLKWCDYIVYAIYDKQVMIERIFFNETYWKNFLYPNLINFLCS